MTNEERKEAERLCPYPIGSDDSWIWVKAWLAGRESMRAERESHMAIETMILKIKKNEIEAERERSAKLVAILQNIRVEGYAENYITQAFREYEASRDE